MRTLLQSISWLALIVILLAPFSNLAGWLSLPLLHHILLGATIAWFASAPCWMKDD